MRQVPTASTAPVSQSTMTGTSAPLAAARWFFGVVLVLAIALVFGLGLLAYSMYVLLLLAWLSRWAVRHWVAGLSATRTSSSESTDVERPISVAVTIKNSGRLPVPWVLLEDLIAWPPLLNGPPPVRVIGRRMKLCLLRHGESQTMFYQVQFTQRGYYQVGPVIVESGDLFGLHRRFLSFTHPQFVIVYPKIIPLAGYELASRRPIGEIRVTHRLYEDPTRITGVRLYQPGDPLGRVHWKATARTGQLHCKTYEPSSIAGATIVLDFCLRDYDRRHEPFRSELAVTAAASLAQALYQMGQQVGLITNGRDAAERVRSEGWRQDYRTRQAAQHAAELAVKNERLAPQVFAPRRGPEQLKRVQEALARLELSDGLDLAGLVQETSSRMPRDATVVVLLSQVTPLQAAVLGQLRRQGFAVTALVNLYENSDYSQAAGLLLSEGIEPRHLRDEETIASICGGIVQR